MRRSLLRVAVFAAYLMSSSMAAAYSSASRSLAKFRDFWTRLPSRSVYQRHLHREPWPYSADRHLPGTLAFIGSFALASDCFADLLGGLPSSSFFSHLSSTNALAMVVSFQGSALHCAWNLILVKTEMLIVGSLGSVRLCFGRNPFVSRRGMWTLSFFYCTHTSES